MRTKNPYRSVGNETLGRFENSKPENFPDKVNSHYDQSKPVPTLPEERFILLGEEWKKASTPDISHISGQYITKKLVCGKDDRTEAKPTNFPYKAIARLKITAKNGRSFWGSGFFISKRCVITCGHCVFVNSDWVEKVEVAPGAIGSYLPYDSQISTRFRSVEGWVDYGEKEYDHGAVILEDEYLFNKIGAHFGYENYLNTKTIQISGYPDDKLGTQWKCNGKVTSENNFMIDYDVDSESGNSGSPIFYSTGSNIYAIGVHSFGKCPNSGIKVNDSVHQRWNEWSKL